MTTIHEGQKGWRGKENILKKKKVGRKMERKCGDVKEGRCKKVKMKGWRG